MSEFAGINIDTDQDEGVDTKLKEPGMYKVILLNDHYTTMDFVVEIIRGIFHKTAGEATKIMMDVHKKGRGVVGTYTLDIASTKVIQVEEKARENNFPLECVIENF
ncbi:MAG: ATP-dependent Clp protease adapter ClpS [Spirochaetales bacterium]|nr:ATP-dependent Clp protease adapter ClpS [Spirochaetales bacterium]